MTCDHHRPLFQSHLLLGLLPTTDFTSCVSFILRNVASGLPAAAEVCKVLGNVCKGGRVLLTPEMLLSGADRPREKAGWGLHSACL